MDISFFQAAIFSGVGLGTGLLSGLFGVGGGFILVPLLIFIGVPIHLAVGTSLAYITVVSAYGSFKNLRHKNIHFKTSTLLIIISSLSSVSLGVQINRLLPERELALAFAALLLSVASYFLYQHYSHDKASQKVKVREQEILESTSGAEDLEKDLLEDMVEEDQKSPRHHTLSSIQSKWLPNILLGLVVGCLSGMFGVGGGFILVPGLVLVIRMPIKLAIGTSLFVIFFSSLTGATTYAVYGNIDTSTLPFLIAGGLIGISIGIHIFKSIDSNKLKFLFNILLIVAATYMLSTA